ncbi:hypothetical protein [Endozoicomonas sp. SESOKO2]|uniref:hypothetical protein n=1 Tax=Endozoicomonas sp. SESOKO2 TaxID=2828743 RepID=UPI0021493BA3|nr:hypothetical protein [Endozoicomonas sp. SESOKO2]
MSSGRQIADVTGRTLWICDRHALRLEWVMAEVESLFPLSVNAFDNLTPTEVAYMDQFSTRFCKLQDAIGAKLFPHVLDLVGEQGALNTFIDKLNRLEKIGAIDNAAQWPLFREMRNAFAHDYPEDSELNAETLNRAVPLASELLKVYHNIRDFALRYGAVLPGECNGG